MKLCCVEKRERGEQKKRIRICELLVIWMLESHHQKAVKTVIQTWRMLIYDTHFPLIAAMCIQLKFYFGYTVEKSPVFFRLSIRKDVL